MAALFAPMCQRPLITRAFDRNRRHEPAAPCSAVARININVFAPQTLRAMVGVAVSHNFLSAVLANKIFNPARKRHGYWIKIIADFSALSLGARRSCGVHESVNDNAEILVETGT